MNNLLEWLWLANVVGPGARGCQELLDLYADPKTLLDAVGSEDLSPYLTAAQRDRLSIRPERFGPIAEYCERNQIAVLTMDDENYPVRLLDIPDAPPVLYSTGHPEVLNDRPTVGMIGTRRPSRYGAEAADLLGQELARAGACIVSGLADGLDGLSHRAALAGGGVTAAFLGCCINKTYPAANTELRRRMEQTGAVFSEYPPNTPTNRGMFLLRNRLIAATSQALCVVEARLKSGTLNTVGHAQRYRRPVFAVPGSVFNPMSEGTNHLLETGEATAAASAGPILAQLGLHGSTRPKAAAQKQATRLSDTAQAVLDKMEQKPQSLDRLLSLTGLPVGAVLAALTELEVAGCVQSSAGGQYHRK